MIVEYLTLEYKMRELTGGIQYADGTITKRYDCSDEVT